MPRVVSNSKNAKRSVPPNKAHLATKEKGKIGISAPSFQVPANELKLSLRVLQKAGIEPIVHDQTYLSHGYFAGSDEARAMALIELAFNPEIEFVWCARGGYGSMRLLTLLDQATKTMGIPPRKMLVGYSDITALHRFVESRWGWKILHAVMPGGTTFHHQTPSEWAPLKAIFDGNPSKAEKLFTWNNKRYTWLAHKPKYDVIGEMVGGNLSLIASLIGTPYTFDFKYKILFLEDTDESLYRIDRMVEQLRLAGVFSKLTAVVLGNFQGCRDRIGRKLSSKILSDKSLKHSPNQVGILPKKLLENPLFWEPTRKLIDVNEGLDAIFSRISYEFKLPILKDLPAGHGPEVSPLPLAANYQINANGTLHLLRW